MKLMFFIIAALAGFACSATIRMRIFPNVNQSATSASGQALFPELQPGFSNKTVGRCTVMTMALQAVRCERKFFMSFRHDDTKSCSKRFEALRKCTMKELEYCLAGIMKKEFLHGMLKEFTKTYCKFYNFYCGNETTRLSQMLSHFNTSGSYCSDGFFRQLDSCQAPLIKRFQKHKGDVKLCGEYEKGLKCVAKTVSTMCDIKLDSNSWLFTRKFNPFCDEKQIQGTKEKLKEDDKDNKDWGERKGYGHHEHKKHKDDDHKNDDHYGHEDDDRYDHKDDDHKHDDHYDHKDDDDYEHKDDDEHEHKDDDEHDGKDDDNDDHDDYDEYKCDYKYDQDQYGLA